MAIGFLNVNLYRSDEFKRLISLLRDVKGVEVGFGEVKGDSRYHLSGLGDSLVFIREAFIETV